MVVIKQITLPNGVVITEIVVENVAVKQINPPQKPKSFLKKFSEHVLNGVGVDFKVF